MEKPDETSINALDKYTMVDIFSLMEPLTVLDFCRSSPAFRKLCGSEIIWKLLLERHFPLFTEFEGDSYRRQYQALANGHVTIYYVLGNIYTKEDKRIYLNYPNVGEDIPVYEVKVSGLPLKTGSVRYLAASTGHSRGVYSSEKWLENFMLHTTLEGAADEVVETIYKSILDELRFFADLTYGAVNSATVTDAANEFELPVPLNIQHWSQFIIDNNSHSISFNSSNSVINGEVHKVTIS